MVRVCVWGGGQGGGGQLFACGACRCGGCGGCLPRPLEEGCSSGLEARVGLIIERHSFGLQFSPCLVPACYQGGSVWSRGEVSAEQGEVSVLLIGCLIAAFIGHESDRAGCTHVITVPRMITLVVSYYNCLIIYHPSQGESQLNIGLVQSLPSHNQVQF